MTAESNYQYSDVKFIKPLIKKAAGPTQTSLSNRVPVGSGFTAGLYPIIDIIRRFLYFP
jgi:hypothetical protein